ncbi:MAG: hypothetical protein LRS49_00825 [Desulfurococcales archaeon]|nr:hypothetical protein [Desulfurococcales archaeon]
MEFKYNLKIRLPPPGMPYTMQVVEEERREVGEEPGKAHLRVVLSDRPLWAAAV